MDRTRAQLKLCLLSVRTQSTSSLGCRIWALDAASGAVRVPVSLVGTIAMAELNSTSPHGLPCRESKDLINQLGEGMTQLHRWSFQLPRCMWCLGDYPYPLELCKLSAETSCSHTCSSVHLVVSFCTEFRVGLNVLAIEKGHNVWSWDTCLRLVNSSRFKWSCLLYGLTLLWPHAWIVLTKCWLITHRSWTT